MSNKPLSTALKSMKFMARAMQNQETEATDGNGTVPRDSTNDEHWIVDVDPSFLKKETKTKYEITSSHLPFISGPIIGRRSFQSYNKEIEV